MNAILLEEKYMLEYIRDMLFSYKSGSCVVNSAKYHHNTDYRDAPSVCRHGILTMKDLKKYGIKDYTDEFLQKMGDIDSHINGNDAVSLAVVGLNDLYHNEDEYNPYIPDKIDFLVSSDIMVGRSTLHYGNEFLCYSSISIDKLRSIDIRLLKLLELIKNRTYIDTSILDIIKKYNCLKDIASTMIQTKLDIPLREASYQEKSLIDIEKLSSTPKLVLK